MTTEPNSPIFEELSTGSEESDGTGTTHTAQLHEVLEELLGIYKTGLVGPARVMQSLRYEDRLEYINMAQDVAAELRKIADDIDQLVVRFKANHEML